MKPYDVLMPLDVLDALRTYPSRQQRQLVEFLAALGGNPFQPGDTHGVDYLGRTIESAAVSNFQVVWRVDDADREIRVLDIAPLESLE